MDFVLQIILPGMTDGGHRESPSRPRRSGPTIFPMYFRHGRQEGRDMGKLGMAKARRDAAAAI
jgi:hypothetical protein